MSGAGAEGGVFQIECDGAASGNPGPAGLGVCVIAPDGSPVEEISEPLGRTTNNVAEYKALLRGLVAARARGARRIAVRMDSELVVKQVLGSYKAREPHLIDLLAEARRSLSGFDEWTIEAVRRGFNARADALAKAGVEMGRERA
jgi:ribonuclease HI